MMPSLSSLICIAIVSVVLSSLSSFVIGETTTCGTCLPVYEGDNAYIITDIWKTTEDPDDYMKIIDEKLTPVFMNYPGFISWAGAKTDDPTVFVFWFIFESKDEAHAALEAVMKVNDALEFDEELLVLYEGTIFWSGAAEDCINESHTGKYAAMRMYEDTYENSLITAAPALFEEWTEMDSFHYYLNTRGLATVTTEDGMISLMYMNVFDNLEDTEESNISALKSSNVDPMSKLLTTTVGEVVFDHNCAGKSNDDEEEKCMTIDELVCGSDAKDFTTLCELLTTVFPDGVGDDSITVFAATDEAFDNASALLAESDFSDEQMESIVFFHAMEGKLMSTDLVCGQTYNMLSGDDSRFVCTDDGLYQRGGGNKGTIMGSPKIIQADIIACYDSVVHIVDEILLPNWV